MPTMVMSQPPKTRDSNNLRKRQKNKTDNIMPIHYMYVGTPKKKLCFYVRERLVYRPTVEVTYDEVFNFLAHSTNDETISLHYSVNGLYVPITTTGQLHTFIRLVHSDPTAFLYVENQAYVWNVTPQNKGQKMEKRVPANGAAPPAGEPEPYESTDEDVDEQAGAPASGEEQSQEDEEYDSPDYDEDEEEEEDEAEDEESEEETDNPITDNIAPLVIPGKAPLNELFVEPKPRVSVDNLVRKERIQREVSRLAAKHTPKAIAQRKWTEIDAFNHLKGVLCDSLATKKMGSVDEIIAEQLIRDVWNPDFPHDEKVLKDSVALLRSAIGAGILCYHQQVLARYTCVESDEEENDATENALSSEYMPTDDPEYLAEFIENSTIVACDILESVQHLALLHNEFGYFRDLYQKNAEEVEKNTLSENSPNVPPLDEICGHMKTALVSARIGFHVIDPAFPEECNCKKAIQSLLTEIEKMATIVTRVIEKAPKNLSKTLLFSVESMEHVVRRECTLHENVAVALCDAENYKWRHDTSLGFHEFKSLRTRGENRLRIKLDADPLKLTTPPPFAIKPDSAIGDPHVVPIDHALADMHLTSNPMTMPLHCDHPAIDTPKALTEALNAAKNSFEDGSAPSGGEQQAHVAPATTPAVAETTVKTEAVTGKPVYSDYLQGLVDKMIVETPKPHNYVYPPLPKPGAIMIPIGGLARCRCSKNCTESLMEPAYEYMERFNEPRQAQWEKTKQKRFKKN